MGINKITVLTITFSLLCKIAICQEVLTPLHCNPALTKHIKNNAPGASERFAERTVNIDSAIYLPFLDDFSYSQKYPYNNLYPTSALWMDSEVYINDQYGLNPPTVGVATFDGLNKYGLPYDTSYLINGTTGAIVTTFGGADTLTSRPVNFRESTPADSIYLSFFYQPGGNGDMPEALDSLVLEFRDTLGIWDEVWGMPGGDTVVPPFKQVLIPVRDLKYFHPGFQFRFRNYATIPGNNDNWNLDYVKMNSGRSISDTDIRDVAFQYNSQTILQNYQQMPWNQFYNFQSTELRDSFSYYVVNNFTSVTNNVTFIDSAFDLIHHDSISLFQKPNAFNISPEATLIKKFKTFTIPKNVESVNDLGDTVADITVRTNFGAVSPYINQLNDTVYHDQYFENYYAYDNGIAETAYSLTQNGAVPELAYQFNLNVPDTLRAIEVFFPYANLDDKGALLSPQVWSSLYGNDGNGTLIYTGGPLSSNLMFGDSLNGFTTYMLDTPILVSGTIYIGFLCTDPNPIYFGWDVNDNDSEYLYYNVGSGFTQSQFHGALMMRPVLGKAIPSGIAPTPSVRGASLIVYPNPVKDLLNIRIKNSTVSSADLYIENIFGQTVINNSFSGNSGVADVSGLPAGIYFVRLMDKNSNTTLAVKFVKTN